MKLYCAPMEGISKSLYRRLHHKYFPGVDKYYAPFISPTQSGSFTPKELRGLLPEENEGIPLVPQLLTNSSDNFIWSARRLAAMGYGEINLNLGCPSQTVTAKRKGAGLLAYPELLDRILDSIFSALDVKISVKSRLGIVSSNEFERILAIYNKYPIAELTVHARVQKDFYRLPARPVELARFWPDIKAPKCYNGDIFFPSDLAAVSGILPDMPAVMLGRGLIRNPALITLLCGGTMPEKQIFRDFHDELFEGYRASLHSENALLCHMKELWSYMGGIFEDSEKCVKRIRKAGSAAAYRAAVSDIFALPLQNA